MKFEVRSVNSPTFPQISRFSLPSNVLQPALASPLSKHDMVGQACWEHNIDAMAADFERFDNARNVVCRILRSGVDGASRSAVMFESETCVAPSR